MKRGCIKKNTGKMARQVTSVSVDPILLNKCKRLNIQISPVLNKLLQGLVARYDETTAKLSDLYEEQEIIQKKIFSLKEKEMEIQAQIISIEEKKQKNQQKDLKEHIQMANMIKRSGVL